MRADLDRYINGDPPVTKLRRKRLSCGHDRGRAIIDRGLRSAWCWDCEGRVRMVRLPRGFRSRWFRSG